MTRPDQNLRVTFKRLPNGCPKRLKNAIGPKNRGLLLKRNIKYIHCVFPHACTIKNKNKKTATRAWPAKFVISFLLASELLCFAKVEGWNMNHGFNGYTGYTIKKLLFVKRKQNPRKSPLNIIKPYLTILNHDISPAFSQQPPSNARLCALQIAILLAGSWTAS